MNPRQQHPKPLADAYLAAVIGAAIAVASLGWAKGSLLILTFFGVCLPFWWLDRWLTARRGGPQAPWQ